MGAAGYLDDVAVTDGGNLRLTWKSSQEELSTSRRERQNLQAEGATAHYARGVVLAETVPARPEQAQSFLERWTADGSPR
jgi:hypothetical protein